MIKIFNATDTDFSSNGNIVINPIKCKETKRKSLNGWFIEVEIPIKYLSYIEKDKLCVVKTKSKLEPQAFRIGDSIKKTKTRISFTANHVMFDSADYFLEDVRPTNLNGAGTLEYINSRTDKKSPFKIYSNVTTIKTEYFIRKSLLEAWTSIEERWGGVFEADNYTIRFLNSVGNDNGEQIVYGKNMEDMTIMEDWSTVCTKLYPVGYDEIMLPEKYIESDIQYEKPYTRTIDFTTELEDEDRTDENMISELRSNAIDYINENKYPKMYYEVTSNINQKMEIGDIIAVKHPYANIKTEVLEYTYDNILEKVLSLSFGNYSRSVKTKFDSIKSSIENVKERVSKQEIVLEEQKTLINTMNKQGYVYIDDNEILILDKFPKEEAQNVWRFGLGGIGFSSNGYEGPFNIAMTMDGQINADFITTGKLSVNIIEGLSETLEEWSKIMIDMEGISEYVHKTIDITKEVTEAKKVVLDDCIEGDLLELHIKGNNSVFEHFEKPEDTIDYDDITYIRKDNKNYKEGINYVVANLDKNDHHYNVGLQQCRSLVVPIEPNNLYLVNKTIGSRFALGTFKTEPQSFDIATNYLSDNNEGNGINQLKIISGKEDTYLVVFFYDSNNDTIPLDDMYNSIEIYAYTEFIENNSLIEVSTRNICPTNSDFYEQKIIKPEDITSKLQQKQILGELTIVYSTITNEFYSTFFTNIGESTIYYFTVNSNKTYKIDLNISKLNDNEKFFIATFDSQLESKLNNNDFNYYESNKTVCNITYDNDYIMNPNITSLEIKTDDKDKYIVIGAKNRIENLSIYESNKISSNNYYCIQNKELIEVKSNEAIYLSLNPIAQNIDKYLLNEISFYDKNKQEISTNEINNTEYEIITPNNCSYIGFKISNKDDTQEILPEEILNIRPQIEYGTFKTNFSEYKKKIINLRVKEVLRQKGDVCDTLDLVNDHLSITRRIGISEDGILYILDEPIIQDLGSLKITLERGTNIIEILNYSAFIAAKYVVINEFTDKFATTVELEAAIQMLNNQLNLTVSKKVGYDEIIARLNMAILGRTDTEIPEEIEKSIIQIFSDLLEIQSTYFKLTRKGEMTATRGSIAGWEISDNELKKGLAIIRAVEEILSFDNVLIVGDGLGKDGNPSFAVNTYGHVRANSISMYGLSNQDKYPASIKIYSQDERVTTNIDANLIDAYNVYASAGGGKGHCMHGIDISHTYRVHWNGSQLQFYVDSSNIGSLSDKRLKYDINIISDKLLNAIKEIEIKQFKLLNRYGRISFGAIAQDVISIFKLNGLNIWDYDLISEAQYDTEDKTLYYIINYEQLLILKTECIERQNKDIRNAMQFLIKKLDCETELNEYLKNN